MCNYSEREQAMVVIRPGVYCDPCLVPLVRALYENGFPTVASCCGHGKQPANVALADGRQVFVADPEWAETIWAAIAESRDGPELCRERLRAERDEAQRRVRELERAPGDLGPGGVEIDPDYVEVAA